MQMALDAMLHFPDDISDDMFESIKALRAALAQPPCATGSQCVGGKCERCAVQPEQQPVAWMHTTATGHVYFRKKPHDKVFNPQPVYTAPPQREWQSLTDKEIEEILYNIRGKTMGVVSTEFLVRAIEAKLKEKNNG